MLELFSVKFSISVLVQLFENPHQIGFFFFGCHVSDDKVVNSLLQLAFVLNSSEPKGLH